MQQLCKSSNGVVVTYDPVHSHAASHINDAPGLKDLVIEAIGGIDLQGREVASHFDMGRVVGGRDVVEVDETDTIVYAMRKNMQNDGLVPFTKSRSREPSPNVALHLVPRTDGIYELSSAWIGTFDDNDEPFPQSPNATENSKNYWSTHAFVWGSQEIVPETETFTCPW